MANSTVLSLFQTTMQGMGVTSYGMPSTVVGNTNQDVVQLLAMVNAAGDELSREFNWQAASAQYNFQAVYYTYTGTLTSGSTSITSLSSTTGISTNPTYFMVTGTGVDQDTFLVSTGAGSAVMSRAATAASTAGSLTFSQVLFPFPSDFDRAIDRTHWDKSRHWEMLGPKTPQEWEWLKSGYISSGPRIRYRPFGGYFAIWPPLGSTENLSFEYQTKYWIYATASAALSKQAFTVDTDTTMFADPLMRALIKLKYFEIKGFDTTALYRDYLRQLDIAKSADAGNPTLSMNPGAAEVLIGWDNIPDSRYGS